MPARRLSLERRLAHRWLRTHLQLAQLEIRPCVGCYTCGRRQIAALSGPSGVRPCLGGHHTARSGSASPNCARRHREGTGGCRPATPRARGCAVGTRWRRSGRGHRNGRCLGFGAIGVWDHACHRRRAGLAAPVRTARHQRRAEGRRTERNPRPHRRRCTLRPQLSAAAGRGAVERNGVPRRD